VFIKVPSANESFQFIPVNRAVTIVSPSLPRGGDADDSQADQPAGDVVQKARMGPQAAEREEQRQQEQRTEMFQPQHEVFAKFPFLRHAH
jgi:hypothetical protein